MTEVKRSLMEGGCLVQGMPTAYTSFSTFSFRYMYTNLHCPINLREQVLAILFLVQYRQAVIHRRCRPFLEIADKRSCIVSLLRYFDVYLSLNSCKPVDSRVTNYCTPANL